MIILVLLLAVLAGPGFAAESPWLRVVVIGASASAGFVLTEPFGGTNTAQCKLNHYLDAAITAPHAPVKNLATAMFFLSTDALAQMEIEGATNNRPTLVIGVDFLFWFCYGEGRTDADRARHFETGLKLLEQIPCPLVVGDIPDVSAATNTGIISADQVPSETARAAANKRLQTWAAARPEVTLLPLAESIHAMAARHAVTIHGQTWPAEQTGRLTQADQLHPTPRGAAILALEILDSLVAKHPEFHATDIRWNQAAVFRIGCQSAGGAAAQPGPARE